MESVNDVEQFLTDEWHKIASLVQECAVYIDSTMIEYLHWYTGSNVYSFFKNAGAIAVYQVPSAPSENIEVKNCKEAVVILASVNVHEIETTLKTITLKNPFECITIICPDTPEMQNYSREKVKVFPHSIFLSPIDDDLFMTPWFADIVPSLTDIYHTTNEGTVGSLADKIEMFVNLFDSLFAHLNVKEDIYFMGKVSKHIAEKLETLPAAINRRNKATASKRRGVSLIFVDRVLDLCTPTSNNTESLLSRILCTLPPLPDHHNDVAIDMSSLFQSLQGSDAEGIPGCLASDRTLINTLITRNQKDVLTTLNETLIDILSTKENLKLKDSLKSKPATRISAHSLEKLVNKFKEVRDLHTILESSNKLQIVLGIIQALTSKKMSQLELLISLEKLVLQNVAVSRYSTSVLGQLSTIIRTRKERGLDTDNILTLLVHIYALAGTEIVFSYEQEQQLMDAIADALLEDGATISNNLDENSYVNLSLYQTYIVNLKKSIGKNNQLSDKEKIANHAKLIMKRLHTIAQQRDTLQDYISLISKSSSQEIVRRVGILQQLLTDVLHPDKPELSDLHHRSPSFISSKLNLLKERAKPHPCNNSWIIVYVVGGVTAEEVREAREITLLDPKRKVTIASSIFLKPTDVTFKYLLLNDDCYRTD